MTDETAYFKSEEFLEILQQYEDSVKSRHPIYMDADDLASIADYYHYNGRISLVYCIASSIAFII